MSPNRPRTEEELGAARYHHHQRRLERIRRENAEIMANGDPNAPQRLRAEPPFRHPRRRSPPEMQRFAHLAPSQEEANARVRYGGVSHPRILMPGPTGERSASSSRESPSTRFARNRSINRNNNALAQRGLIASGTDYMMPTGSSSPSLRQAARQASRASETLQQLSDTLISLVHDNDVEMTDAEDDVEIARPASRHISWDARLANSTIDHNAPLFPGPADRRATIPDYRQPQSSPSRPRHIRALDAIGAKAHRIGRGIHKAIKQVGRRPTTPPQHVWARTNQSPINRTPPRSRAQRQADAEENYYNVTRMRTPSSPTPGAGRGRRATFFDRMENHGL
ncbi:hypothetical protein AC579_4362 [Pseudocercospora musae]|uniref:Uncharacterized protein n=1 Tax=Pseudocercospora musae TaxID=113226 RepID=A0A139IQN2_9PEZI|nr:hypothetical protein AC579_4362 [Pseudocercospora musae]